MPDRTFFFTARGVFPLGMLAFLGYSYLDPVREWLAPPAELPAPRSRVVVSIVRKL
jgi:hypothetical protein